MFCNTDFWLQAQCCCTPAVCDKPLHLGQANGSATSATCCRKPSVGCRCHTLPLAQRFAHLIVQGDMHQLKHELCKPPGHIPHILHRVYISDSETLSQAIDDGKVDDTYIRICQYHYQ